jgi:hypothetical protein
MFHKWKGMAFLYEQSIDVNTFPQLLVCQFCLHRTKQEGVHRCLEVNSLLVFHPNPSNQYKGQQVVFESTIFGLNWVCKFLDLQGSLFKKHVFLIFLTQFFQVIKTIFKISIINSKYWRNFEKLIIKQKCYVRHEKMWC